MKTTISTPNSLTAILAGMGITIATGIVMAPVVIAMFFAAFELPVFSEPKPTAWINDVVIIGTAVLWIFVATAAGGWTCAGASSLSNAYRRSLFLVFIWTVIILSLCFLPSGDEKSILILLAIFVIGLAGYFTGTILRVRKKKRAISELNKTDILT